jgi:hypothetical protein
MTTGFALVLAAAPTIAGLMLLGLADPKRRRTAREDAAPRNWRVVGWLLLAAAACGALTAGIPALLIWFAAATALGWAFTHGLALAPARTRLAVETALKTKPSSHRLRAVVADRASGWPERKAVGRLATVLVLVALAAVPVFWAWRAVDRADRLAGSIAALQAIDLLSTHDPERAAMRSCWRMLGLAKADALHDLLSNRAMILVLADGDGIGEDLQRCVLGQGGEGTTLVREPGAAAVDVTIDAAVVAALHAAVVRRLLADETLAELAGESETARRLICRHVADAGETRRFLANLRGDRAYAKTADLLAVLPSLERPDDLTPLCQL